MWDTTEENMIRIEGVIAENAMWGDEITPCMFKDILSQRSGDITVWIDSPGGEVFAAIKIYNMLKEHNGKVTVKIDSLAASAATVIAMAGDEVLMAPGSMLFVHDPQCFAFGYQ